MASINLGFRDQRNSVELALAPGRPLSVSVIASGNLPLGKFGSALKVASAGLAAASAVSESVGMIKSVATMAPASFTSFKLQLQSQAQNKALSATLTSSLDAFNTARVSGTVSVGGTIPGTNISVGGTFDVNNLLQLSGMGSGAASAAAVAGQLAARAAQLAALTDSISNAVSAVKFFGTTIKENFNKQANPTDDDLDKPSTPAIARGGADAAKDTAKKTKASLLARGAKAAVGAPKSWVRNIGSLKEPLRFAKLTPGFNASINMTFASDNASQSAFTEPNSAYKTQWPWNQATITESGHMFELDDTPGGQRVHLYHRAGSFIEMHPDGKVVYKATNDQYSITLADQYVQVKGKCLVSVDGDASIYAKGNVQLQSDESVKINAKKNFEVYADNISLRAKNKSTVDGTSIDLRYVQLPGTPVVTSSGLAPRLSMGAIKTDMPDAATKLVAQLATDAALNAAYKKRIKAQLLKAATATPLEVGPLVAKINRDMMRVLEFTQIGSFNPGVKWPALKQPKNTAPLPKINPLANPLIYQSTSQDAILYRGRLFDTPEETSEMELYQAHVDTRREIKDIPAQSDVPVPGEKITPTNLRPEPEELRRVVYLNRSAYKGVSVSPSFGLGTSSFTLGDLVDVFRAPDIANFITPPVILKDAFVEPTIEPIELPPDGTLPGGGTVVLTNVKFTQAVAALFFKMTEKYPIPNLTLFPNTAEREEECRKWMDRWCSQARYTFDKGHPDYPCKTEFGHKKKDSGSPRSKDFFALKNGSQLIGWDLFNTESGKIFVSASGLAEDITGQLFIPVQPVNSLGGDGAPYTSYPLAPCTGNGNAPQPNPPQCSGNLISDGWDFLGFCSDGCVQRVNGCGVYPDEISCLRNSDCNYNE